MSIPAQIFELPVISIFLLENFCMEDKYCIISLLPSQLIGDFWFHCSLQRRKKSKGVNKPSFTCNISMNVSSGNATHQVPKEYTLSEIPAQHRHCLSSSPAATPALSRHKGTQFTHDPIQSPPTTEHSYCASSSQS